MGKMKILWAVNPFQDGNDVRRKGEAFLKSLEGKAASVVPVYVSSPAEMQILLEFSVPLQARYRQIAEKALRKHMSKVKGVSVKSARVLEEPSPGQAAAAKALADHARREKADLLVLGTHARKGFLRFTLGSYAETMLSFCRTPAVLVNPKCKGAPKIQKILFATDLSPASRKVFSSFCRFAKVAGASVEVVHAIECPKHWSTTYGYLTVGSKAMTVDRYLSDLRESRLKTIGGFLKDAKSQGVKAAGRVVDSPSRAADILLKTASSGGADMIALASQSSRLRAGLLGSVARDVLRGARVPVWVLRSVP